MKMFKLIILSSTCAFAASASAPQVLDLKSLEAKFPVVNVFDLDPTKPIKKKGGLLELKWREVRKEWKTCRGLAATIFPTAKDLQGWVARTRLNCALEAATPKGERVALASAFRAVPASLMQSGPWSDSLRDLWVRAGLMLADDAAKKQPAESRKILQTMFDLAASLTREQRALILTRFGNLAVDAKRYDEALFFLRQAGDLVGAASVRDQISAVEEKKFGPREKTAPVDEPALAGAEVDADKAVRELLAQGKRKEAVEKMVQSLNRFPSGRFARKFSDQVQEILLASSDSSEESWSVLDAAKDADSSRLSHWASVLHRRLDDRGTLELAEKALEGMSTSPDAAKMLWIAGRSASFLGEPEKAARFFDRLVQYHGSTEYAGEGLFRLGLQQIRNGNFATASRLFDKLIAQNISRWDLNARYWRARALEKSDQERFKTERDWLIDRYPFTYYGLRLRAERDGNVLEFSKTDRSPLEASPAKTWLVGAQTKTWARFRRLAAEGWLLEAQAELSDLPSPSDPWSLLMWSRILAKAGQYPAAILFVNRATERDETLRHPRYIENVFPRAYSRWIDVKAKENGLDPVLVRSLIRQESAFGLRAVSTSNALGLMQMIPPTAREVADELKMKVDIPEDMYRPEINVPMGTHYIAKMIREFGGTVPLGLAAYNAGPHRLGKWLRQRPALEGLKGKEFSSWEDEIWYDELPWSETSFYVKAILRNILIDRLIDQGRVAFTPAFWSDLQTIAGKSTDDEVKRR